MSGDPKRPRTPAWRKEVKGPPERRQAAQPEWRKEPVTSVTARGWSRRTKLGVGSLLLLLFSGLLFWVILWLRPPKQAALVLVGAGYEENLTVPHNVYGWAGLDALAELGRNADGGFLWWKSGLFRLKHEPLELRTDTEWDRGLSNINERTVIVFLALHGGVDNQGAYFLRQDADLREENRLRLDKVLSRLEEVKDKSVLLILDATQNTSNWPLGVMRNDFARKLNEMKDRIEKTPRLVVLSSSSEDERSWPSEEYRQSIFTHYVLEGLKGAAAPDGSRRLSALDLHRYVKQHVQEWVRANRSALQQPVLLGGEERADKMEITAVGDYTASPPPDVPDHKSGDFDSVYETYRQLQGLAPSPAVYTPHLWRLYLDTFVRYEELVRAGDQRKTGDLKKELDRLADAIRGDQRLDLDSAQNALAMPAVLGISGTWPREAIDARLRELWDCPAPEREQRWEEIKKLARGDKWQAYDLRLRLDRLIYERGVENPKDNVEKAAALLEVVNGKGNDWPAEAHFLRMLLRDIDPRERPDPKLLEDALRLRLQAENVALAMPAGRVEGHPYSEYVFPWIQAKVEEADKSRRWCHDHVFGNPEAWESARKHFIHATAGEKPNEGYNGAQKDADVVREALRTCHEVLLTLPYYSRWLANRYVYEENDRNDINAQVKAAEELWEHVHYLVRQLNVSNAAEMRRRLTTDTRLEVRDLDAGLERQTATVRTAFERLRERFDRECKRLAEDTNYTQGIWHAVNDALTVPLIDPKVRFDLLKISRRISRKLLQETQGRLGEAGLNADINSKMARESASRNGRLALACLGQRWFEDPQFKATEEYGKTQNAVKENVEEGWWRTLVSVGDAMSLRWRMMADEVRKLSENARRAPLSEAADALRKAELLARQMDGATVRVGMSNPVREARRMRTYQLLLWQAQRTLNDHWFAYDSAREPYYRDTGRLYVKDAKSLVEGTRNELSPQEQRARLDLAQRLEDQLNQPGELDPERTLPERLDFTGESRVGLEYLLKTKGWLPEGFPVAWMETAEKTLVVREPVGRRVLETGGKTPLRFRLEPPTKGDLASDGKLSTTARLRGVYRGQLLNRPENLTLYLQPDVVVYQQPTPPGAGIAVRAAPEIHEQFAPHRGAIAIVLDCSGSMGVKTTRYDRNTPCKYHEVTTVLRGVLDRLPEGVNVSVFVFSHVLGPRTPAGEWTRPQPKNPEDWIQRIRPPRQWKRSELAGLMSELEDLAPWNETPLVSAMIRAKEEGFPKNFTGFKTLLVLTDGEDNCFKNDTRLQARHNTKDIGTFVRREFDKVGMLVNFVGFKVAKGEAAKLQAQFKDTIDKLNPPGNFFTTDRAEALGKLLPKLTTQELRFRLERDGGGEIPEMPPDGWLIGRPEEPQRWIGLDEGAYRLRVQLDTVLEQRIQLERGDYLVVSVRPDRKGFERIPHGNTDTFKWQEDRQAEGWLLTLPYNRYSSQNRRLDILLALESQSDRFPGPQVTLKQTHPRPQSMWIETKAQGTDEQPTRLRWGEVFGFEAPTWELNLARWPYRLNTQEPALPTLDVWWNWQREHEPYDTIRKPTDAGYKAFEGRELRLGQDPTSKMRIDSIEIEDREMELAQGAKTEKVTCLLVQATFPGTQRVFLQPDSLDIKGYEHHYYSKAGRYTGIFWPVTQAGVQNNLKALRIFSVEQFKTSPGTLHAPFRVKESEPPDRQGNRPTTVPERMSQKVKP